MNRAIVSIRSAKPGPRRPTWDQIRSTRTTDYREALDDPPPLPFHGQEKAGTADESRRGADESATRSPQRTGGVGYRASGAVGKLRLTRVFEVWGRGRPRCAQVYRKVHRNRHGERGVKERGARSEKTKREEGKSQYIYMSSCIDRIIPIGYIR